MKPARLLKYLMFWPKHFLTSCLYPQRCDSSTAGTIYQYNARTLNGSRIVNFSDFAGKSVLFVNVATY
uniref:Glutathione peroxidase 3 n=1 Tax=Poecilia latipinna TaxID=48699 RepID=A0A3B3U083_9TELE